MGRAGPAPARNKKAIGELIRGEHGRTGSDLEVCETVKQLYSGGKSTYGPPLHPDTAPDVIRQKHRRLILTAAAALRVRKLPITAETVSAECCLPVWNVTRVLGHLKTAAA